MEILTKFLAFRFKAVAAVFIVGLIPVAIKAFETGTGIDIPGDWEISFANWVTALLAGIGVNYAENVKAA